MRFATSRLRSGELLAGAAAVVLLVCLFALPWYGLDSSVATIAQRLGVSTSRTGWESLTTLRWLMLVTIACGARAGVPPGDPARPGDAGDVQPDRHRARA